MTKRDKAKVITVSLIAVIGLVSWLIIASTFMVF